MKEVFKRVNESFSPSEDDIRRLFEAFNKQTNNNYTDIHCHDCRYKVMKYFKRKYGGN